MIRESLHKLTGDRGLKEGLKKVLRRSCEELWGEARLSKLQGQKQEPDKGTNMPGLGTEGRVLKVSIGKGGSIGKEKKIEICRGL